MVGMAGQGTMVGQREETKAIAVFDAAVIIVIMQYGCFEY